MSLRKKYIESPLPIEKELLCFFNRDDRLVIFDIGCCEGEDSIRYANLFPHSVIYSFEPNPDNIKLAQENIRLYDKKNIYLINEALSDTTGVGDFYISSGCPPYIKPEDCPDWDFGNKSSSLLKPEQVKKTHSWLKFNKKITVKLNTLSSFCESNGIKKIDFIHMDVQGAELKVLQGAQKMIDNIKVIWTEVSDFRLYKNQALRKDIEKFLLSGGFFLKKNEMKGANGDQLYVNKKFFTDAD
jgi:FkbM family methyltransferase